MRWSGAPPSTPAVCTGLHGNSFMLKVLDIHMRSLSEEVNQTQRIISGLEAAKQSVETSWAEVPAPGIEAGLSESTQSPAGTKWHVGSVPESQSIRLPPLAGRAHGRFGQLLWSAQPDSCNSGCCRGSALLVTSLCSGYLFTEASIH